MELKWLHDFVSLANTGNFSRSAEERNVTQSAFSRRIQSLETWLDTELIDRTSHPVSLTDSGIRFLEPAKKMIRQAERMQENFRDTQGDRRGLLTFTSSTNLAMAFLPKWISRVQDELGTFDIRIQTDVAGIHDHFEALRNKQSDFLLHYGHGVELLAMDANRFDSMVIGEDTLVPVCHRDREEKFSRLLNSQSKEKIPYISPHGTSFVAYRIAERIAENHPPLHLDTIVESSIVGCSKGFVAEGAGIAWLPITAIQPELDSGEFAKLSDKRFAIPLPMELYRYESRNHALAERFWEYVKTAAAETH